MMDDNKQHTRAFLESINVKQKILDQKSHEIIPEMGELIINSIIAGNKLLTCGNGGSAADAQHLAAELLIRLKPKNNRQSIPALSLAQDISTITACGNDFGFDQVFGRVLESIGNKGDILLIISTSGNSKNIIYAAEVAKKKNIAIISFLGSGGGKVLKICDKTFLVPSEDTARIQESHITAGHALMEYIENGLLKKKFISTYETN
jgi:D-sedoheptulose 7-phosphate isomerase|tara:strand:+ start:6107 stop:6724 length:618 start_codon:yes stop_codon:yes gene_type:complete